MAEEKKALFLDDRPDNIKDDFGVHTNIVETILDIIEKHDVSNHSFTIGLFGEWGSGKSFVIDQLRSRTKESEGTVFFCIDVWKYSGFPLLRSILFDIDKQLKDIANAKEKKQKLSEFSDGYKAKDGKRLEEILNCDESYQDESELNSSELKVKLTKLIGKYKWPLIILLAFFIVHIVIQFVGETSKIQTGFFKSALDVLKPLFAGVVSFGGFVGIAAILLSMLKVPLKDIGELVFFRRTVRDLRVKANFSPEQFEKIFDDIRERIRENIQGSKMVLVFDNIDRCEPQLAYETLSTIKTFMDKAGLFYIIPCDDEAIKKYIAQDVRKASVNGLDGKNDGRDFSREFAKEFIDKLFQTYIRIPALKEVDRDKFIRSQLEKLEISEKLKGEDVNIIIQILYYAYKGKTPRTIKRFLNDFSFYYFFAEKCDCGLVDDVRFFAIMIAIKQAWKGFESILLENPDFFRTYQQNKEAAEKIIDDWAKDNRENKKLKEFFANISLYIPKIKDKPIAPFIYMKESENDNEIVTALREGDVENVTLNEETLKIVRDCISKLTASGEDVYFRNALKATISLVEKNFEGLGKQLVVIFWDSILTASKPAGEFESTLGYSIIKELVETKKQEVLLRSIDVTDVPKEEAEQLIINFLGNPIEKKKEDVADFSLELDLFRSTISTEDYKFPPDKVKELFTKWHLGHSYLNHLLEAINREDNEEYLPEYVLEIGMKGINDSNFKQTLDVFKFWNVNDIPKDVRIQLVQITNARYQGIKLISADEVKSNFTKIKENLLALKYILTEDIGDNIGEQLFLKIINVINALIEHGDSEKKKTAIEYLVESFYFIESNNALQRKIPEILLNKVLTNVELKTHLIKTIEEGTEYAADALEAVVLRKVLLKDSDIANKIYKEGVDSEISMDFSNLLLIPLTLENIKVFESSLNQREDIELDVNGFAKFLIIQLFTDVKNGENITPSQIMQYLNDEFDHKLFGNAILKHSNIIFDFCKKEAKEGITLLKVLKNNVALKPFNEEFVQPLLAQIDSDLKDKKDVSDFKNIETLLDSAFFENKTRIKLIGAISQNLLAKGQTILENTLGLLLLSKLSMKTDISEFKKLIAENDNREKWA